MRQSIRSHLTFASVVSPAALLVVLVLMAPTASAHNPQHPLKVSGTWSDPPGACIDHIISLDPSTGDFACTGTSEWTGTWTGSTTWTLTGNQNPTTGATSGRINEVFTGHLPNGSAGTLTFVERITIDPAGNTDIRGRIVDSSGGLARSHGHARWRGVSNAGGSGSGSYLGHWNQDRKHNHHS